MKQNTKTKTRLTLLIDNDLIPEMKISALKHNLSLGELTEKIYREFLAKTSKKSK